MDKEETTTGRVNPIMSKKRYKDISTALFERFHDEELVENIMKDIARIMKFDENIKFHTNPEILKKRYELLKIKAQEKGMTVNELTGNKEWYLKNKEDCNKKRTEYNRVHKNKSIPPHSSKVEIENKFKETQKINT